MKNDSVHVTHEIIPGQKGQKVIHPVIVPDNIEITVVKHDASGTPGLLLTLSADDQPISYFLCALTIQGLQKVFSDALPKVMEN